MTVVIDSSALLALIRREPGYERATAEIRDALVSPVILAETLGKAARFGFDIGATDVMLAKAGLRTATIEAGDLRAVAELHARRDRDISLADRFCLALAMRLSLPLVTADRPWRDLGLPVELRYIR